jgi:maltooligosyltrehalose trehalohydrolase
VHRFRVWAPTPAAVELVADDTVVPMTRDDRGWWCATLEDAGPGTRYGFRLDGGPVRPDPRSGSQPDGIDGLSLVVDHDAFSWSDASWRGMALPGSVLYELHVGTFTPEGTFEAVVGRLPHLVELGVDAIELMPVAEFSGERGWGYDGVDLFAPHHSYGGPEGLKALVDACHRNGLGVVLDVVYNHLGPAGNHLREFGPYFSDRHRTNWGDAVNFDGPGSDEVRRFVVDNAVMWLRDYHVDGLRLDAVHAISDDSACHVLEQLAVEADALAAHVRRPLFLVAESDRNDPRFVRSRDAGGYGLDAAWADEWHHALHAVLTGERDGYYEDFGSLCLLGKALEQAWAYDGSWSPHRRRHHGRSPQGLEGQRFVVFAQNHDQVGNRAAGERLAALTTPGRARVAAALLLTTPFVPLLFQGEEWGMSSPFQYFTDHRDAELGRAVSEGRRSEFAHFGWDPHDVPDPQAPATFERSRLDWSEPELPPHAAMLAWYHELVALRRSHSSLTDPRPGSTAVEVDEERGTLVVQRGDVSVLVNLGTDDHEFRVCGVRLLAGSEPAVQTTGPVVRVPPDAAAVVERRASGGQP